MLLGFFHCIFPPSFGVKSDNGIDTIHYLRRIQDVNDLIVVLIGSTLPPFMVFKPMKNIVNIFHRGQFFVKQMKNNLCM